MAGTANCNECGSCKTLCNHRDSSWDCTSPGPHAQGVHGEGAPLPSSGVCCTVLCVLYCAVLIVQN
jgi:hypothetical protein